MSLRSVLKITNDGDETVEPEYLPLFVVEMTSSC